jgi:hypothetical protein
VKWPIADGTEYRAPVRERQAGELSDDAIKRILDANTYEDLNDSRQGGYVTGSDHDTYDMGMIAGLKYARDHGYLKPSQAGELSDEELQHRAIRWSCDHDQSIFTYSQSLAAFGQYLRDHCLKPLQAIDEPVATLGVSEGTQAKLDRVNALLDARKATPQAIGEQTPVAWRNVRRNDLRIPVRLHNALASLALDTIGAIVDHLGVKVNDDRDGTYWRLRTALMKMRGVGRSSAIEGASAIMEAMDSPSTLSPEARDRAIDALERTMKNGHDICDGPACMGCWKDDVRAALSALRGQTSGA